MRLSVCRGCWRWGAHWLGRKGGPVGPCVCSLSAVLEDRCVGRLGARIDEGEAWLVSSKGGAAHVAAMEPNSGGRCSKEAVGSVVRPCVCHPVDVGVSRGPC